MIFAGILLLILIAVFLIWFNEKSSTQAQPALIAQVYFDGEYQIGDGEWRKIVKGEHIPSTKGDVTLKGNLHMLAPDGEYVGVFRGDVPIAFYTNHINLTVYEAGYEPVSAEIENPLYGKIVCRCESITEGEIVDAISRNPGAKSLDGIKRRVRGGMGRCQGGFCSPKIMEILSRELKIPVEKVTKCGGSSQIVFGHKGGRQ